MPFQIVGWNGIPKLRPPQILWHARVQPLLSAPNEFSNNCVASSKLPATRGHETCSSHVSGLATINKFPSRVAIISIVFARPYFEENHTPGLHSESICKEREREAHPPARCITYAFCSKQNWTKLTTFPNWLGSSYRFWTPTGYQNCDTDPINWSWPSILGFDKGQ